MKTTINSVMRHDRPPGLAFRWLACVLIAGTAFNALAGNPWFTSRTVGGETKPIEVMLLPDTKDGTMLAAPKSASFNNGYIDLVISLSNNPHGDNNGNTKSSPPSEQDVYEKISQGQGGVGDSSSPDQPANGRPQQFGKPNVGQDQWPAAVPCAKAMIHCGGWSSSGRRS